MHNKKRVTNYLPRHLHQLHSPWTLSLPSTAAHHQEVAPAPPPAPYQGPPPHRSQPASQTRKAVNYRVTRYKFLRINLMSAHPIQTLTTFKCSNKWFTKTTNQVLMHNKKSNNIFTASSSADSFALDLRFAFDCCAPSRSCSCSASRSLSGSSSALVSACFPNA